MVPEPILFLLDDAVRRDGDAGTESEVWSGWIGASPAMQAVAAALRGAAATEAPVLLVGEVGTGKSRAAHLIHLLSARADGPFVVVDCAAVPAGEWEEVLFGPAAVIAPSRGGSDARRPDRGQETGAGSVAVRRRGRAELAAGGTLFLDHLEAAPSEWFARLGLLLRQRCWKRTGEREERRLEARVIAAVSPEHAGRLRSAAVRGEGAPWGGRSADGVVRITLPPLRERGPDVWTLAEAARARLALEEGKAGAAFSPDARRALERHAWPGNLSELEERIRRALIVSAGPRITAADLELGPTARAVTAPRTLREAREAVERDLIATALRRHGGKIAPAAAELGVSRPTLYDLIARLGLRNGVADGDGSGRA